jgi:hypothetical protein
MGNGFEAFDTGLYFKAWSMADVAKRNGLAPGEAKYYWSMYVLSRKDATLNNDMVIRAFSEDKTQEAAFRKSVARAVAEYGG